MAGAYQHSEIIIVHVFVGILCFSLCRCQTYDEMKQLKTDIFTGYSSDIIPVLNQSDVLKINITITLFGIVEVDTVRGILTLVAGAACSWYDEKLTWDPTNYGGITKTLASTDDVWVPVIAVGNPIEFKQLKQDWTKVMVFHNGQVGMGLGTVIYTSCTFGMRYWPFDKQLCKVVYYPDDSPIEFIQFSLNTPAIYYYQAVSNSEWTLENYYGYSEVRQGLSQVVYVLKLKRQSMFYVLTIILPLTGLFMINILVFVLPQESGERVSYSITITLALAVFLTVVADEMPRSSEPMSLMCIFILIGVCNSLFLMVITIGNMRWYHKESKTPPGTWHRALIRISKGQFRNRAQSIQHQDLETQVDQSTFNDLKTKDEKKVNNSLVLDQTREATYAWDSDDITWKDVSQAFDIICFWVFLIFSVLFCLIGVLYVYLASDYDQSLL